MKNLNTSILIIIGHFSKGRKCNCIYFEFLYIIQSSSGFCLCFLSLLDTFLTLLIPFALTYSLLLSIRQSCLHFINDLIFLLYFYLYILSLYLNRFSKAFFSVYTIYLFILAYCSQSSIWIFLLSSFTIWFPYYY